MTVHESGVATEVMAVGLIIERNESLKWQIAWWDVIRPHARGLSGARRCSRARIAARCTGSDMFFFIEPLTTNH